MDLKALTIAGTVILLVAGWAMTAMLNQMENQESDINALGQRTSTVETQIKDHEELPAHNEPK